MKHKTRWSQLVGEALKGHCRVAENDNGTIDISRKGSAHPVLRIHADGSAHRIDIDLTLAINVTPAIAKKILKLDK